MKGKEREGWNVLFNKIMVSGPKGLPDGIVHIGDS